MATDTIGARIRYWRLRRGGMSQTALAGLAGVSQPYISQVESGRKTIERRSTLVAIARALQVTVADLLGQPGDPTDPPRAEAGTALPDIWAALIEIDEGERRAPTVRRDELDTVITCVADLRTRADFPAMSSLLPNALIESAAHDGLALTEAACHTVAWLKHLGYRHLALLAAKVAVTAANTVEHPAWIGAARFEHAVCLPPESAGIATRISDRAVAGLQAQAADPQVRQMLGLLHLSASLTCATEGRTDDAMAHINEAAREADSLGDPADGVGFCRLSFGPTNVGLWRMSVAGELGEHGKVVELARGIRPDPLKAALRHEAYWTGLGRALAHSGTRDREALAAFMRAERAAPVSFAANPMVHDIIATMVRRVRRRSVSEELRIMARRVGIHITDNRW